MDFERAILFTENGFKMSNIRKYYAAAFVLLAALPLRSASADVRGEWKKDRYPVDSNGKWGYIDNTGAVVIKPRFEEAAYFSEGLAPVKLTGKYGYIDKTGKVVIAPRFNHAFGFREGVAWVEGAKSGFIDKTGKIVISAPPGVTCREFRYGLAVAISVDTYVPPPPVKPALENPASEKAVPGKPPLEKAVPEKPASEKAVPGKNSADTATPPKARVGTA